MSTTTDTDRSLGARFADSVARFERALAAVDAGDWTRPTPCADWDVRALVAHVVDEHRWVAGLLGGRTIAEIEPGLDADPLGDHAMGAWRRTTGESLAAVAALDDPQRIVHLSFGDVPAEEYLAQLTADHVIHTWDLARAIGADEHLDAELVAAVRSWFEPMEPLYRGAGAIGERAALPERASERSTLLAMFGRADGEAAAAVSFFDEEFATHDPDRVVAAMTPDCVFESTSPPDGSRVQGRDAVRDVWAGFFAGSPSAQFDTEEMVVCGHRVVTQWRYSWTEDGGGHVRGVDLFTVRDGLVAEKRSYVKG
jgi:uncharacterized protein (TIGR03086 family)